MDLEDLIKADEKFQKPLRIMILTLCGLAIVALLIAIAKDLAGLLS